MLKQIAILIATLIICGASTAQNFEFDLSDYKAPDLNRHRLHTELDLGNKFSSEKFVSELDTLLQSSSLNGRFVLGYSYYHNSAKQQSEAKFSGVIDSDVYKNPSKNIKSIYIHSDIQGEFINRFYFRPQYFFETSLASYFRSYRNTENTLETDSVNNRSANIENANVLSLKIGRGRIEPVGDARHAVYILDELAAQNRLSKEDISHEEIRELAELIANLKYKRFFDTRLRQIYEIQALDSFLNRKDYISQADARYFSTLNDYRIYGDEPHREAGSRISAVFIPEYMLLYNENLKQAQVLSQGQSNGLIFKAGAEFNHRKPIKLKWQNSADLYSYFGTMRTKLLGINENRHYKAARLELGANERLYYYPDTRTQLSVEAGLHYVRFFPVKSDDEFTEIEADIFSAASALSISYYISPKLRLYAGYSINYIQSNRNSQDIYYYSGYYTNPEFSRTITQLRQLQGYVNKNFNGQFNFSIRYSLF